MIRIAIGCDHIVTDIKNRLRDDLVSEGYDVVDCGTFDSTRTHYPIYGKRVAELVANKQVEFGIVICGTGVGITNSAQKIKGSRVVLVRDVYTAKHARQELNANILGFGGRIVGYGLMKEITDTFLNTNYEPSLENNKLIANIDNIIIEDNKEVNIQFNRMCDLWDKGHYKDD